MLFLSRHLLPKTTVDSVVPDGNSDFDISKTYFSELYIESPTLIILNVLPVTSTVLLKLPPLSVMNSPDDIPCSTGLVNL